MIAVASPAAGVFSAKIGPRWPLVVGPIVVALGFLLARRIGTDTSYWLGVLPAMIVIALGLAGAVAPLTTAVLMSVDIRHTGAASGLNSAVARTGGLLAVSLLPALAGLTGHDYRNPDAFAAGYRNAMLVNAGMLGLAGFVAAVGIRNQVPQAAPERGLPPLEQKLTHCYTCPVEGPRLETIQPVREERAVEP